MKFYSILHWLLGGQERIGEQNLLTPTKTSQNYIYAMKSM